MARLLTVLKRAGFALLGVAALAGAGLGYLALRKPPQRPASPRAFDATPERVARGKYLVEAVCACNGCHSERDYTRYGAPVVEAGRGAGGPEFNKANSDFPGVVAAQNITSHRETGLGAWTDGEIARAIREGVDRKGDALFPLMPYAYYRAMSDDDVEAVVVYLRTLAPIENEVSRKHVDFPVSLLVKSAPKPLDGPVSAPRDEADHLAYGKYLVTLGGCRECHSEHDASGEIVRGREFAGGWPLRGPWGTVVPANITPHPTTFVGSATREQFVARFKSFTGMTGDNAPKVKDANTIMAWEPMSRLTERDLGAIYDYLKTLPPLASSAPPPAATR